MQAHSLDLWLSSIVVFGLSLFAHAEAEGFPNMSRLQPVPVTKSAVTHFPAMLYNGRWSEVLNLIHSADEQQVLNSYAATLVEAISCDEPEVQWLAAYCLRHVKPLNPSTIRDLLDHLCDQDCSVRAEIAEAVADLDSDLGPMLPIIMSLLNDRNARVRASMARAAGNVGIQAKCAVPCLLNLMHDKSPFVRTEAATAHWKIEGDAKLALDILIPIVADGNDATHAAVCGIREIGQAADSAVPTLIELVQSSEQNRTIAISALASVGPNAKAAVPTLLKCLNDADLATRLLASVAIQKIGAVYPTTESCPHRCAPEIPAKSPVHP